jgi:hypothetical protein
MQKLVTGSTVVATLIALMVFSARGGASNPPADKPAIIAESGARNPWTKLELDQRPDTFRFAVVSDRTGAIGRAYSRGPCE